MAFGRNKNIPKEERAEDYYKLHTQAIQDLITASPENSPEVSEEELRKYQSHRAIRLSETMKALLLKFWLYGACCFFFLWGIGYYVRNTLDQLVIMAFAMGIVNDLLVNPMLRYIARVKGGNDRFMMYPKKKYVNLFLNILHSMLVIFLVFLLYSGINLFLNAVYQTPDAVHLGVGPILFGLFYLIFDLLLIKMKHTFLKILDDAKQQAHSR
ncbi:MAG: hypothetical protein IJ719_23230 [Clostridia bacterium]|nr:hypothetical protein [Clostridia bacterium]